MTWLLRGTRVPGVIAAATLGALLTLALHGRTAALPSLTTGELRPVPLAAVAALAPVAASVLGWGSLPTATRLSAVRSLRWLPHSLAALAVAVTGVVAWGLGDTTVGIGAARDVAGLCAVAAIGWRWLGPAVATAAGPGYLLLAFLCGQADGPGQTQWWAWILRSPTDPSAAVLVVLAVVVSAVGLASGADRTDDLAPG